MADTTLILKTLVEGTEEARKGLDNVTKGVEQLGDSSSGLNKLDTALKNNAEGFANIGVAAAAAFAGIVALGTVSVMQASKLQDLRQSFDTLLWSAVEGKKLFLEIQKMAVLTPFTSADLASATSTMLGFGVAQEKVLPIMSQLGDVAMGNNDRFQRLALAFAQVSAMGRLQGQDLLQMVNAGFNPLQEISKKTGESMADLKERMSDGRISLAEVEEALKSATSAGGRFEGGMLKASKTFSGVMSTFKDNIGITLAAIGGFANGEVVEGGLLDSLTKGMAKLMPMLDRITQWASQNPEVARNILLIGAAVTGLIAGMVSLGFVVGKIMIAWQALSAVWVALSGFVTVTLWPALVALWAAIWAITAPVWAVIGVIAALIAAGVALYMHWDQVVAFAEETWEKIKQIFALATAVVAGIVITVFQKMGIDIVAVFNTIVNFLRTAWTTIKALATEGMTTIAGIFNVLADPIKKAWSSLWEGLGGAVGVAFENVKNIIKASLNWIVDRVNFIIRAINSLASKGGAALGISVPMISEIPRLAEGGIVKARPGGIIANIGEGGQDEAVIPLNKMKGMGGFGGGVTITFTGVFGKDAAQEISDLIVKDLARAGAI